MNQETLNYIKQEIEAFNLTLVSADWSKHPKDWVWVPYKEIEGFDCYLNGLN